MPLILIIDDDAAVLTLFAQFLKHAGYAVETAVNGRKAMENIRAAKPDLVITDIMMPEMDGLEVIREIRDIHPGMPVIAISGGMRTASVSFLPHAQKLGADCVLEKPISLVALRDAAQKLLGKKI